MKKIRDFFRNLFNPDNPVELRPGYEDALKNRYQRFIENPASVPEKKVEAMLCKIKSIKKRYFYRAYIPPIYHVPCGSRDMISIFYFYTEPSIDAHNFWVEAEANVIEVLKKQAERRELELESEAP